MYTSATVSKTEARSESELECSFICNRVLENRRLKIGFKLAVEIFFLSNHLFLVLRCRTIDQPT